jgi:MFS family permease
MPFHSLNMQNRRIVPAPLRRVIFRRLWGGMSMSYAGDRLQQLAQGWLVATLTGSALAVGGVGALGALPLLLSPLGGVVADQVDRWRILIVGQVVGAAATAIVAALVLADWVAIWHIYVWAFINGMIALVSRPSYKVALTGSVPAGEVRSAVAINSMTETLAMVVVNAGGSVVLGSMSFTLGFTVGALWGGAAIDRFGAVALVGSAVVLGAVSIAFVLVRRSASSLAD